MVAWKEPFRELRVGMAERACCGHSSTERGQWERCRNGQSMHARPFQHIPTTTLGTAVEYRGFHLLDHALGTNLVRWRLFSLANIFQNLRCCNPHPHHKLCNAGSTSSTFSPLRWAAKSWLPSWPTPAYLDPTLLSSPCTRIDRLWLHETSGQTKT